MIEMFIIGIAIDTRTGSPIIILNDEDNRKALPIWIGQAEASAMIRFLENIETPRPMTHDLLYNIIETMGLSIKKIEINDLNENTYYATLFLEDKNGAEYQIDSRPSDAIILAMKSKAQIYVTPNVVMEGTVSTDVEREEKESEEFKSFLRDIKPSDFKKFLNKDTKIDVDDLGQDDSVN